MHRRFLTPFALVVALTLAGCADNRAPNPNSVVQPVAGGLDPENFRRVWMNILPVDNGDWINRIHVERNLVFVATPNNVFYVLDKPTGVLKYFRYVNGGGRQVGTPVVMTNYIVYPGQSNLEVYKPNGEFVKSIPVGFTISSDAAARGDEVYFGADLAGGELADVDVSVDYRPVRWRLMTFGEIRGAPALYNDVIFVGSGDGGVRAVNPDRTASWALKGDVYNTDGHVFGDIVADESGVYAASNSGRLVCIDRNSGTLKWQYIAPAALVTGPVVTATSVYQYVPGIGLAALDKSDLIAVDPDGRRKMETQIRTPRWISSDAVQFVAEDALFTYIRTVTGELWALDHQTGQVRYRGNGVHFAALATNVNDNIIYAAMRDGVVYAIRPALQPGSPGYLQ